VIPCHLFDSGKEKCLLFVRTGLRGPGNLDAEYLLEFTEVRPDLYICVTESRKG